MITALRPLWPPHNFFTRRTTTKTQVKPSSPPFVPLADFNEKRKKKRARTNDRFLAFSFCWEVKFGRFFPSSRIRVTILGYGKTPAFGTTFSEYFCTNPSQVPRARH
uniref:(northern house mosquito) hypothetical protein n=1 Tax=Culex pipiens TaxID=7175 RepID=A0A8D8N8T7_CULPI